MLDDVVRYIMDEVAMDGSIGTSPSRFIALFSRPSCPLNLASHTTPTDDPYADPNAVVEVSQEQEQEREHYAAYVWRMMVDLEGMSVVMLGQPGKVGPNRVEGNRVESQKMDVDDSAAVEDHLATVDQGRNGDEEMDALGDVHGDFMLDPALAMEAQAIPHTSLHQAYEDANVTHPDATLADAIQAAATPSNAGPADDALATVNPTDAPALVPEPIDAEKELEAEKHDLMLLKDKYGDKVVMRASEAEVMNTLTGSYVRPGRLSNIVYTALQFIARGKEFGMSVLDIAKKTGQKPSTVFYLVKTLTDMGLVAKIKDTESNKTNIAVHRRYLNDNFQYQLRMEHLNYLAEVARDVKPDVAEYEIDDNIPINPSTGLPQFPPFGMESLGSRTFIKYRLIKLLKSDLWHHLIENRLLLKFMGFTPAYTVQTRRQFQRHIVAFKREGLIDEVLVPDESIPDKPHRCLRLAEFRPKEDEQETFEGAGPNMLSNVIDPALIIDLQEDDDLLEEDDEVSPKELGYDYSYTIDHAVLQVVKNSGTRGVTIRQIMRQLNQLDHKTVDCVVARYERLEHHPTHLNDFLFKVTQEVHQREKRLRVFTLENFRQRCMEDGIQLDGEIPTHPNIGRYADLSECKFARTQAEAKAVLDMEWIAVPRACAEINQEHKKFTMRMPGQRKFPKTKKAQMAAEGNQDPQVLGRPRKYIRTVGLDGKLVRRTQFNLVPVHPELPSVYLYNSKTRVFFDVPDNWDGVGPVEAPPDWDTAIEPTCPIIPSTGLPARPELEREIKRKAKLAAQREKQERKNKKRDRDDGDDADSAPKKRGRPRKAVDENAPPPGPKKKGRPRKSDKADPPPDEGPADAGSVEAEAIPEAASVPAKSRPKRGAKAQPAPVPSKRPLSKRKGANKSAETVEEQLHSVEPPIEDGQSAIPEPMDADLVSDAPATAAPVPDDRFPESPPDPPAAEGMGVDELEMPDSALPPAESHINADSDQTTPALLVDLVESEFALDPSLAGPEQTMTDQQPSPVAQDSSLADLDPALNPQDRTLADMDPSLAGDELASIDQSSPAQGTAFFASQAQSVSEASRKRRRQLSPVSPTSMAMALLPEPKKSKFSKLHKPRGSLQHPYRKREILEYLHSQGGVANGGYFICVNLWEWVQTHKGGKSTFDNVPDKVTMERLLNSLEADKEIKTMSVAMNVNWGGADRVPIVMLPDTPQGVIANFVNESKRIRQRATVLPPRTAEPGFTRTHTQLIGPSRMPVRLTEQAMEPLLTPVSTLESLPADRVREMYQRDWRLLAQSYGYIAGIFRRAKYLHLEVLRAMKKHGEELPNGDQILPIELLRREPTLENICKILPVTVDEDDLHRALEDPETAQLSLHECPVPIQAMVGARRKTMRFKLARLFVNLSELGILECGNIVWDDDKKPISFEPTTAFKATYLKVAKKVPIYNYSVDAPAGPKLPVRMTTIVEESDLEKFWYDLWFISLTRGDVNAAAITRFEDPSSVEGMQPVQVPMTLKRKLSSRLHWQSGYALQKAQRKYLDYVYQSEPGSAATDPARHESLAYRIFAPVAIVEEYLAHLATRLAEPTAEVRIHPVGTRVPTQQVREAIAQKVKLRNERLEAEWSEQVTKNLEQLKQQPTTELLAFLEPLHKQYLRNPRKYGPQQMMNAVTSYFARLNTSGNVKTRQGRFTPHRPIADHVPRRARTKWTPQMDERARDAVVILEARKERLGVQNVGHYEALGQLFTQVDAFKVRQRVKKWRKDHPANEAYLQRMKAAWKQVYEEHADEVPDPHPDDFQDFPLDAHVDIFRKYVKRDQRVSAFFVNTELKDRMPNLPESVEELSSAYDVELRHKPIQVLDDVWAQYGDEKRDKALMSISAVGPSLAGEPSAETESALREAGLIESVIKLIVGNPAESFDEVKADRLLSPLNRSAVEYNVKSMLQRNILTAYDRNNPNRAPGRAYLFQDSYYRALNNPIAQDVQQDAEELLHTVPEDEFVPWPIIAKEGEFASLLALVSEDMVDMHIDADAALDILDTKGFRRARVIDDDCIEVEVNLKLNEKGTQAVEAPQKPHTPVWPSEAVISSGLHERHEERRAGKAREKVLLGSALLTAVENAGKDGVTVGDLKGYFNEPENVIITAVEKALDNGKLILTGYSKPVLVHPSFKAEWELSEDYPRPKQWLDIDGQVVEFALQRCKRALYGLLVQKPGINQYDLRENFAALFNRQEINDLLDRLLREGRITRVVPKDIAVSDKYIDLMDVRYEPLISYLPEVLW